MSEWFKSDEKLPYTCSSFDEAKKLGMDRYQSRPVLCCVKSEITGGRRLEVGKYNGFSGRWQEFEHDEYRGTSEVTHWMPLPELPEDIQQLSARK